MKSIKDLVFHLQNKPYEVRLRILWISVLIIGLILVILWFLSLRQSLSKLNPDQLLDLDLTANQNTLVAAGQFITTERAEILEHGELQIFFKIDNPAEDILNVSLLSEIELEIDGTTLSPLKIYDRQNQPFVQKVLSHTAAFGILIFPDIDPAALTGTLTFDNLFFEQKPEVLFSDVVNIDFDQLLTAQTTRN